MKTHDEDFVVAIATAIVAAVDPDSVRYVEADAEAYFADPRRALDPSGSDTPLGSGLEDFLPSLTFVALYVAQKAVDYVTEETISRGFRKALDQVKRPRPALAAFDEAQAERVRRSVVDSAKQRGLDQIAAEALAGEVLTRLEPDRANPSD